jgi:NADP-dependent 3-hydroxy acid dehydrogenase YdfG
MADASIQTALAVGVPTLAVLVGILVNNSGLNDLRGHTDARFADMREMWRSDLRRVEKIIDARLKHLEAR